MFDGEAGELYGDIFERMDVSTAIYYLDALESATPEDVWSAVDRVAKERGL